MIIFLLILVFVLILGIYFFNSKQLQLQRVNEYEKFKTFLEENNMRDYKSVSYKNLVEMDIDIKQKRLALYSYYYDILKILDFKEILDFEIAENGESIISSRTGSAVVGGLLFGGLGAVAGASGSRKIDNFCDNLILKIYTNDVSNNVITIDFVRGNSIYRNSDVYKNLTKTIDEMIGFLKIARENNRQEERKEDKNVVVENVEEIKSNNNNDNNLSKLKELAELKEKGIITEQEFEEGKKKILSKL